MKPDSKIGQNAGPRMRIAGAAILVGLRTPVERLLRTAALHARKGCRLRRGRRRGDRRDNRRIHRQSGRRCGHRGWSGPARRRVDWQLDAESGARTGSDSIADSTATARDSTPAVRDPGSSRISKPASRLYALAPDGFRDQGTENRARGYSKPPHNTPLCVPLPSRDGARGFPPRCAVPARPIATRAFFTTSAVRPPSYEQRVTAVARVYPLSCVSDRRRAAAATTRTERSGVAFRRRCGGDYGSGYAAARSRQHLAQFDSIHLRKMNIDQHASVGLGQFTRQQRARPVEASHLETGGAYLVWPGPGEPSDRRPPASTVASVPLAVEIAF